MAASTQFQFSTNIVQALMAGITSYQWGNMVPKSPAQFETDLRQEAKGFGINWPSNEINEGQIDAAVTLYKEFYADLLTRQPKPQNPTEEFNAWWQDNHV